MSRKEIWELIFCIAGITLFFVIMVFALWDISSKPWFRNPMGNLFGSIFVFATGLVGFVLYSWVFVVLTRRVITVTEDSSSIVVQPRIGKPIHIDLSQPPRAYSVRTVPYLETPSQKAFLFLKPRIFVVLQSHAACDRVRFLLSGS